MTAQLHHIAVLARLISGVELAVLTASDTSGMLRSRPVAVQRLDVSGELWLFMGFDASVVDEVHIDGPVNVSFIAEGEPVHVSISGMAEPIGDPELARRLWQPSHDVLFPKGADDPEVALLCVRIEHAEYGGAMPNTIVPILGFMKEPKASTPQGTMDDGTEIETETERPAFPNRPKLIR